MINSSDISNFGKGFYSVLHAFSSDFFTYSYSPDGKLNEVSDSFSSILTISQSDFLNNYRNYLSNNQENINFCNKVSDPSYKKKYILEIQNSYSQTFIFNVYETYVKGEGNTADAVYGIAVNVTDAVRSQKLLSSLLKGKEERLTLAFEASDEGFWDLNYTTGELFLSRRCYTILGLSEEIFDFKKVDFWVDKIHIEDLARIRRIVTEEKLCKSDYFSFEFRAKTKDGDLVWLFTEFKVVKRGGYNKPLRIAGTVKDITQRKDSEIENERLILKLEEAVKKEKSANEKLLTSCLEMERTKNKLESSLANAEQGYKVKSAFLNIVSHELRTPLSGILGFSQLLNKVGELNEKQHTYVDYIIKAGKNLLKVLTDIIDISVLEANASSVEINEFCINELIDDIFNMFKDEILSKKIKINTDIKPESFIISDKNKVHQIFLNLISNAIKFTPKGSISVSFREANGKYIFKINDTGIGVEQSKKDFIFETFTQIESPDKRRYGGLGIGLSIVKKIIKILGGDISLESSEAFSGSTFVVELPIKAYSPTLGAYETDQHGEDKTDIHKKELTVYYAEDDEVNFLFIENLLGMLNNVKVKGFYDCVGLIDELENEGKCDIILLDIQMPLLNGFECLDKIKKYVEEIPIVAISAFSRKNETSKFIENGFSDFLPKPFSEDDFFHMLKKHLID